MSLLSLDANRSFFATQDKRNIQTTAGSTEALQKSMALAGWEISHLDVDLTGDLPRVELRLDRFDGRWLLARVDRLGRAGFETFHRERSLGMSSNAKGRRPLSPQLNDVFLGRRRCVDTRQLLGEMTSYVADNSLNSICLEDLREAWSLVLHPPLQFGLPRPSKAKP